MQLYVRQACIEWLAPPSLCGAPGLEEPAESPGPETGTHVRSAGDLPLALRAAQLAPASISMRTSAGRP